MAIKRIRELPSELPHARLYLDDIEEISTLLAEAYTSALTALNAKYQAEYQLPANKKVVPDEAVKIVYRIGDSQMDSIDDLREHGGYATNFSLIVLDSTSHAELHVHSFHTNPKLRLGYPLEEEQWSVYARVKAIFDRRQLKLKNSILSWPEWLKLVSYILIALIFPFVPLLTRFPLRLFLYLIWTVLIVVTLYVIFRPSRILFVRSHERSKLSATARQGYVKAVVLLVVGGLVGKLIDLLFARLKH